AAEHLVEPESLLAPILLVAEIGIVDDLRNALDPAVAYREFFGESFKGAVLATMAEPFSTKHVERNGIRMPGRLRSEDKAALGINKTTNQPGRRNSVNSGPRPCHPNPVEVLGRFPGAPAATLGGWRFCLYQQFLQFVAQRILEEVNLLQFLEVPANTFQGCRGATTGRNSQQFPGLMQQLPVVAGAGVVEAALKFVIGKVVECVYLDHRRLSFVGANRRCQPFHAFLICRRIREQVARAGKGQGPITLQFAPDLHALAGIANRETKYEQQPGNGFAL